MSDAPATPASPDPGLVAAHLGDLAGRISVEAIDEVWIFPTRMLGSTESTVLVISAFEDGDDRRRVLTAHYTVRRQGRASVTQAELVEHGSAPADRIGRVIDGVMRRLSNDADPLPRAERIGGDTARWAVLLEAVAPPSAATPPSVSG